MGGEEGDGGAEGRPRREDGDGGSRRNKEGEGGRRKKGTIKEKEEKVRGRGSWRERVERGRDEKDGVIGVGEGRIRRGRRAAGGGQEKKRRRRCRDRPAGDRRRAAGLGPPRRPHGDRPSCAESTERFAAGPRVHRLHSSQATVQLRDTSAVKLLHVALSCFERCKHVSLEAFVCVVVSGWP